MRSKDVEETDSIVSLEDSDIEIEPETKPKTKNIRPKTPAENIALGLTKTGRIKREMSEAQKKVLAGARVKARAKRSEIKAIRDKEKSIKQDDLLIRKLTAEKKIIEHKKMLQNLAVDAGYASESKRPKPKRKVYTHKEKDEDNNYEKSKKSEIQELEDQLKALQKKHKIIESDNSESEVDSDSESEEYVKPQKPIKKVVDEKERTKPKKPIMHADPPVPPEQSRKKNKDPFGNTKVGNKEDQELQKALNSLFS